MQPVIPELAITSGGLCREDFVQGPKEPVCGGHQRAEPYLGHDGELFINTQPPWQGGVSFSEAGDSGRTSGWAEVLISGLSQGDEQTVPAAKGIDAAPAQPSLQLLGQLCSGLCWGFVELCRLSP